MYMCSNHAAKNRSAKQQILAIQKVQVPPKFGKPVFVFALTLGRVDACSTYSPLARAGFV